MKVSKKSKLKFLDYLSQDLSDGYSRDIIRSIISDIKASPLDDGADVDEDEIYDAIFGLISDPSHLN